MTSTDQAQATELAPWDQFSRDITTIWHAHEEAMKPLRDAFDQAITEAAGVLHAKTSAANRDYDQAVSEAWDTLNRETSNLYRDRDDQADQARGRYLAAEARNRHALSPKGATDAQG